MDELQLVRELLPGKPSPSAEVAASARARMLSQSHYGPGGKLGSPRRWPWRRRWLRYGLGLPLVAGAAAIAVFAASSPGSPAGRPAPTTYPGSAARVHATLSAQVILLEASAGAASNAGALTTGRYWRTQTVRMDLMLAGPAAHPYDMAFRSTGDLWYARAAGQLSWDTEHALGATPATAADAMAWQATGSPRSWITSVAVSQPQKPIYRGVSVAAAAPATTSDQLNGKVGRAVGDGTWLTASQFRAFPADPAKLKALMTGYVRQDYSIVAGAGMPPVNESLMGEALNLLEDPVTPQVRSAVYQVMAGLPGVRSLGSMRDPLGRSGYGIEIGDAALVGGNGEADEAGRAVAIIDPASGALLATEVIVTAPGRTILASHPQAGGAASPQCRPQPDLPWCGLPVYYGPRDRGQVWMYTAIKSAGWTNGSPSR